jgi:hypothetical protein
LLDRRRGSLLCVALAGALALPVGAVAAAATPDATPAAYTFQVIAASADGFDPFEFGCAAINNAGQVAFRAVDDDGIQAIYRGDGAALTTIARDKPSAYDFMGRNPSINDAGQVSFAATLEGPGEAIQRGDGTTLDTVALTTGTSAFRFFGFDTSINERGRVAFKAELDNGDQGLFSAVSSEASKTYYLASTSELGGDQSGPSIRGGKVAFFDRTDDDLLYGIFLAQHGEIDTVIDSTGEFGGFDIPSLGRAGRVAVHAFDDAAANDFIIKARNGAARVIADTSGKFGSFGFRSPSINLSGQVAYAASLDGITPTGLYVGRGRPVVEVGDALGGSTVANVVACTEAFNDHGQLGFVAQLDDGRTLVVRADPV